MTHTERARESDYQQCTITHNTLSSRHTQVHTPSPPLRLTLALGTTKELPGCSCKVIKEALTAHWFRPPQSGVYWITLEEGCGSGHQKRVVQVGLADTLV